MNLSKLAQNHTRRGQELDRVVEISIILSLVFIVNLRQAEAKLPLHLSQGNFKTSLVIISSVESFDPNFYLSLYFS